MLTLYPARSDLHNSCCACVQVRDPVFVHAARAYLDAQAGSEREKDSASIGAAGLNMAYRKKLGPMRSASRDTHVEKLMSTRSTARARPTWTTFRSGGRSVTRVTDGIVRHDGQFDVALLLAVIGQLALHTGKSDQRAARL
jgi:hypothetical protein